MPTKLDTLIAQFHEKYTWAKCPNTVYHANVEDGIEDAKTSKCATCQGTGLKYSQLSRECIHLAGYSEEDVPMFWLPQKCRACHGTGHEPLPITLEHILDIARQVDRVPRVLQALDESAYGWKKPPNWEEVALVALLQAKEGES